MTSRLRCAVLLTALGATSCARETPSSVQNALPTLSVTHWTERTELFMEHPPLIGGRAALFAVHLTTMGDFKPVAGGQAKIEFTTESGGQAKVLTGPPPARPGAFRIEAVPPPPGRYRWALVLDGSAVSDRHDLGSVTVFADEESAKSDAKQEPPDDPAAIAYLKEQQWTNEFATALVQEADVRTSIRAPATVHPLPGGEAIVAAPAAGRLTADVLLSIGARVRTGQVLAHLEPRLSAGPDRATLDAEVAEARAAAEGARAELARSERLLDDRAVPARRVDDARRATVVAEARLRAAEARLTQRDETLRTGGGGASGNAFALQAPIGGRLAEVMATLGASYDEGAPLFRIVRTDRLELEVQVQAADVAIARQAVGLALEIPGLPKPLNLVPHHVHDAGVVDATTRALPLQMEIDNPGEHLLVGQVGTAVLYGRDRQRMPALPSAAVLMEAGRPYVFVQIAGEHFARRFVEIASRDGDLIGVTRGVSAGDRVVTRGAYDVQLASAAKGLPAEGHVH
jgi:membrane fusion protein, heavy metal efflux system